MGIAPVSTYDLGFHRRAGRSGDRCGRLDGLQDSLGRDFLMHVVDLKPIGLAERISGFGDTNRRLVCRYLRGRRAGRRPERLGGSQGADQRQTYNRKPDRPDHLLP